jgi:hypothetical protein
MASSSSTILRRQAQRRLVEHQQARRAHHRARHGHHLLLAAAHGAGQLAGAFAQLGEVGERLLQPRGALGLGHQPAAQLEVLGHRHLRETAAGLRPPAPGRGFTISCVFSGRSSPSSSSVALARDQAVDGLQQRGLAGAVGAQDHGQAGLASSVRSRSTRKGP